MGWFLCVTYFLFQEGSRVRPHGQVGVTSSSAPARLLGASRLQAQVPESGASSGTHDHLQEGQANPGLMVSRRGWGARVWLCRFQKQAQ